MFGLQPKRKYCMIQRIWKVIEYRLEDERLKKILKTVAVAGSVAQLFASAYLLLYALYREKISLLGKEIPGAVSKEWDVFIERSRAGKEWMRTKKTETITILSEEGLRLTATMLWAEKPTGKTVVAVHGYRGNGIRDFAGSARFYHELGYNLLIVNNRAHGNSEGKWIGFGWNDKNDIRRWCEYLVDREQGNAQIVLLGVSMGGAAVMMAAGEDLPSQVKAIIEDCGYSSVWEQFWHVYPEKCKFPKRFTMSIASGMNKLINGFTFKEASSILQLKKNKRPVLFIHGGADDFVPTKMVYDVFSATRGAKRLLIIEGAGHALSVVKDPQKYFGTIEQFLHDFVQKGE